MDTNLCEKCKCLEIDDRALGGFERSVEGQSFLVLNAEDEPQYIDTKYHFEDIFPRLPHLAESASAGCDFCRWLRKTVLKAKLASPAFDTPVVFSIQYLFGPNPGPYLNRGLRSLILHVKLPIAGDDSIILGDIDSNSGEYLPLIISIRLTRTYFGNVWSRARWLVG